MPRPVGATQSNFTAPSRRYTVCAPRIAESWFRDKGEYLEISRVLDRKQAYR
jgi:hypothetical protein